MIVVDMEAVGPMAKPFGGPPGAAEAFKPKNFNGGLRMISTYPVVSGKYLINGEWKEITETVDVINPANTSEVVGQVAICSEEIVNETIEVAVKAYETWSRSDVKDRATRMNTAAEELAKIIEESVTVFVRENGKTLVEAKRIYYVVLRS